jgi:hypothetical protein
MSVPPCATSGTGVPPSRELGDPQEHAVLDGATGAGRERAPLSVGQRGLWLSERLAPDSGAWNVTAVVHRR